MALQTVLALSAAAVALVYLLKDLAPARLRRRGSPGCGGCAPRTCPLPRRNG